MFRLLVCFCFYLSITNKLVLVVDKKKKGGGKARRNTNKERREVKAQTFEKENPSVKDNGATGKKVNEGVLLKATVETVLDLGDA